MPGSARPLLSLAALLVATAVSAQGVPEQAVKATYLAKFMPYVEWRQGRPEALTLCVVGRDPFGPALDRAAVSERVAGQQLSVRRMAAVTQASGCHLAFLGGSAAQSVDSALKTLQGAPVLTVTDARHGAAQGIIHFAVIGGRVRFSIDDALAARGSMAISSKLLSLAVSVRQRGRG